MREKPVMHVLSHTHWDREWYQPFQGYRRRLVHLVDALMDLLEKRREFVAFHLDGQTSPLFDYLEIRPEERDRLARHIRSGRIIIGPWFTMPDEVLLSGEAIVRNLLAGCMVCADTGVEPMPVGYVSDVFGHVSQLPQILAGFGIDTAFLHRGTGGDNETSELVWEGADGTESLVVKAYPWTGYQDFMEYRDTDEETIRLYESRKLDLASAPALFALDGNDHQAAKWDTPEAIARMNRIFEDTRAVHSTMGRFIHDLKKSLGPDWSSRLPRVTNQLHTPARGGAWSEVFFGTGSARLPLKQANDQIETLLARVAEPLNAWAAALGSASEKPYLDLAWRYLFLNQPHDSICGCSIDQVHRDMMYRFDQARMLADDTVLFAVQEVAGRIDTARLSVDAALVTVFNLRSVPAGPTVMFECELLHEETAGHRGAPALLDEASNPVTAEVISVERAVRARPFMFRTRSLTPATLPRTRAVDRFLMEAEMTIPAMGYRTLRIAGGGGGDGSRPAKAAPAKVKATCRTLENEHLKLTVGKDGRIALYDRQTETHFRGLHFFEDCGDAGNGWDHKYPDEDLRIRSTDAPALTRLKARTLRTGGLSASIEVAMSLAVPADLKYTTGKGGTRSSRSRRMVRMPVVTELTLRSGSRMVECRTRVENKARCHRLRVIFPSGRASDKWQGDLAFDIVSRSVKLADTTGWKESEREEKHIKHFAAVADDKAGLAVITKGLNEAAVQDNRSRAIALTLFRAFRQRLLHETTVESQLPGTLVAEYAIAPFTPHGAATSAQLMGLTESYKVPLYSCMHPAPAAAGRAASGEPTEQAAIDPEDHPELKALLDERPRLPRTLPAHGTLLELPEWLLLSTMKISEDSRAVVIRMWNPLERKRCARIRINLPFKSAHLSDMLEKPLEKLPTGRDGVITLTVGAKKIVTVRVDL